MTRPKKRLQRRALPVLASETVRCERLCCWLAIGSCVGRWQRSQQTDPEQGRPDRDIERGSATQFVSCRSCPDGAERAEIVGNDNGGGR